MPSQKTLAALTAAALLVIAASTGLPHASAAGTYAHAHLHADGSRSPYRSPELWATINVCSPKNAPDVVGVRGSMPGDGNAKDAMYMRFSLQYYEASTGKWLLSRGGETSLLAVGSASTGRQYGRSFTLTAPTQPKTLRGVVSFEWVRDKRVVFSTERVTTAGRKAAGADPVGYSAETCLLS